MLRNRLLNLYLALWLGVAALAANAFEQQQLANNVFGAMSAQAALAQDGVLPAGFHVMPDGTVMAGPMAGNAARDAGGHTHKGYADCVICSAVAELAGFTLPALSVLPLPALAPIPFFAAAPQTAARGSSHPAYSSRAPPVVMS